MCLALPHPAHGRGYPSPAWAYVRHDGRRSNRSPGPPRPTDGSIAGQLSDIRALSATSRDFDARLAQMRLRILSARTPKHVNAPSFSKKSPASARGAFPWPAMASSREQLLSLQRTHGNRAVQRIIGTYAQSTAPDELSLAGAGLRIAPSNDHCEQEADQFAEAVVTAPHSQLSAATTIGRHIKSETSALTMASEHLQAKL